VGVSGVALEVVFCFWVQVGGSDGKNEDAGLKTRATKAGYKRRLMPDSFEVAGIDEGAIRSKTKSAACCAITKAHYYGRMGTSW
jgi:hypothetical protein